MNVIVCIDNRNGMMFNHRRQSQDRSLRERIVQLSENGRLLMSPYSARQFKDALPENAVVSDCFLDEAAPGDYCFVEDSNIEPYTDKIEELIVYKWNRDYPGDTFLPVHLEDWHLESMQNFPGYSHDEITEEVYSQ